MFTDRFLEVPIKVVDRDQKEMFGEDNAEKTLVRCKINPFEINDYREDINDATVISFKNGSDMVVECCLDEFECLVNEYFNAI